MTSTEQFDAVMNETRSAMEKSVEVWKQGMQSFTEKADMSAYMPKVDFAAGLDTYAAMTMKFLEAGTDFSEKWTAAMTSFFDVLKEQSETFTGLLKEQTEKITGIATEQAEQVEKTITKPTKKAA